LVYNHNIVAHIYIVIAGRTSAHIIFLTFFPPVPSHTIKKPGRIPTTTALSHNNGCNKARNLLALFWNLFFVRDSAPGDQPQGRRCSRRNFRGKRLAFFDRSKWSGTPVLDSMMASFASPANMLSAIAPRKDSAQSSDEGLKKQTRGHAPHITSPLANCSSADIVTNDERAKSPDLTRVLSPMRPRRTPKLVNAPAVRWRLPSGLQRMPSLDSVLSSNTSASDVSTVRHAPAAPHNIALPVSSASSVITTLPDTVPEDSPLPPLPSPRPSSLPPAPHPFHNNGVLKSSERGLKLDTRFNEALVSERPRINTQLCAHQPHLLSPVTEVSSIPSIRSSIADIPIQEIGTAERLPLSDWRRQDVHIVGASEATPREPVRDMGETEERYSQSIKEAEEGRREQERRVGVREVFGRLGKSIKGAARKFVQSMVRKQVTEVLARVLQKRRR
jgi:hypothetical protein